jgi:uncharacterized protein (TIGR03067 family)
MNALALLMASVAGLGLQSTPSADEKKELEKFQGKWAMVSLTLDGGKFEDNVKQFMVVKGTKSIAMENDMERGSGTIKIDPTKNPPHYDITYDSGPAKGMKAQGIYKIEDDKITIVVARPGKERPTKLASEPGSGTMMFVFKKVK